MFRCRMREGLACDVDDAKSTSECRYVKPPGNGEACGYDRNGKRTVCKQDLGCYDEICLPMKNEEGARCTDIYWKCAGGMECTVLNSNLKFRCAPLRGLNENCKDYNCKPGLMCSDDDKCVEKLSVKQDCSTYQTYCKEGLDCRPISFYDGNFKVNAVSQVQRSELYVTSFAGADFTAVLLKVMLANNLAI